MKVLVKENKMPYVTEQARIELKRHNLPRKPDSAGELNYLITDLLKGYLNHKGLKYDTINDVIGALEGAKLEFYRRIAVPYENGKIAENGDVYD